LNAAPFFERMKHYTLTDAAQHGRLTGIARLIQAAPADAIPPAIFSSPPLLAERIPILCFRDRAR
jgi:hypothetical protein